LLDGNILSEREEQEVQNGLSTKMRPLILSSINQPSSGNHDSKQMMITRVLSNSNLTIYSIIVICLLKDVDNVMRVITTGKFRNHGTVGNT
jgi:hypothetical protein